MAGTFLLLVSLAILFWGVWPFIRQVRQVAVGQGDMQLAPVGTAAPTAMPTSTPGVMPTEAPGLATPAVPEQRLLVLEVPAHLRNGDSGLILLTLEMDMQGQLTASVQAEDEPNHVEPIEIPNVYETHTVIAEARLDLAGMEYRPEGEISEALLPGKSVMFIWSIRPAEVGMYHGTVWLHLRFVPLAGGLETRSVLSAQRITIEVVSLLGLKGSTARILGSVGVVLGSILGLDGVLEWIWKRTQRGRKGKAAKAQE